MEDAVKPKEQQKPAAETSEGSKKTGTPPPTPTAEAQGKKSTNKPNQGWKSTKRKNVRPNETKRKELPHFVRTEMEILKHLRRVNRDLRILLQPKYHRDSTARGYKCSQPVRQCREQVAGKTGPSKANAVSKKNQHSLAKGINVKINRQAQQVAPPTGGKRVASLQTHQSSTRKQGGQAVPQIASTAARRNTLQRLMLYFRPKRKLEACQSVQKSMIKDNKKSDANEAMHVKKKSTLCCKLKRGLQATRMGNKKVKAQHIKATESTVKNGEALQPKFKEEKVLNQKVKGRERILKPKARPDKSLKQRPKDEEAPKQQVTDPLKRKEKEAELSMPGVKNERKVRENILTHKLKCLGAESKSLRNEDDSQIALMAHKKRYFLKALDASLSKAECAQQQQKAVRQSGSTISNEKQFGNCLSFFKPFRKARVPVVTSEEHTASLTQLKKVYTQRKSRQLPTNIEHLPSTSHIDVKYAEAIKAIRRHNRDIYKDPHKTPSTSSLEEYFYVLSERMAREQKEADERKPRHRGLRGTSNLQRRRARPPIK